MSIADDDLHRRAVFTNYAEQAPRTPEGSRLWCYTDALSYVAGETVRVHVNATVPEFEAVLARDGATLMEVHRRGGLTAGFHHTPDDCSVAGCGWPVAFEIPVAETWPSGVYRLTLSAAAGASADHLVIIRPGPGDKAGRLLLVAATASWTAYNDWGGSNHYEGLTGPEGNLYSPVLSIRRPYARGFVTLPGAAPRIALATPPDLLAPARYPHMEWAWLNGYSKKYASAGWASYDRHFVVWAEAQGYRIDVVAQTDLHYRPEIIRDYACLVMVGHDEYWSWEMRDAVDAYVESGGGIARFAANFMWQIRLEDHGRTQICYKYRARAEDPIHGTADTRLTTESWEAPGIGRPGALTFGLNATRGLYAGWGGCAARGAGGFTVYRPDHWAFAGTGLSYGDLLGAQSKAFGYEVDGLDYEIRGGLPYPAPGQPVPDGIEILALGLSTLIEEGDGLGHVFIGRDEVDYVAGFTFGDTTPESIERVKRGAGMIVSFARGAGEVFHAGSCEWVAGLLRRDPFVERVTRTVLDRFIA
jgi:hypothetical protein